MEPQSRKKNKAGKARIPLDQTEIQLRRKIRAKLAKIMQMLEEPDRGGSARIKLIDEMGTAAHELHLSLERKGYPPVHHEYMISNRGMPANDPGFYKHLHPVEDLLAFLDNPLANVEPEDRTIGDVFEFAVYSRRLRRKDKYKLKRIEFGWEVIGRVIEGQCDKGGRPFLYENFQQDSIQYPSGLYGRLDSLWKRAFDDEMSHDEVQQALNKLANWVSLTERNTPREDART